MVLVTFVSSPVAINEDAPTAAKRIITNLRFNRGRDRVSPAAAASASRSRDSRVLPRMRLVRAHTRVRVALLRYLTVREMKTE